MKKRLISVFLTLAMFITSFPAIAVELPTNDIEAGSNIVPLDVDDLPVSGTCGDNLTWEIDENGTLTISGEGEMASSPSWRSYSSSITSAVIDNGVTSVSRLGFHGCSNMKSISIPDSVTSIGESAFRYCSALESIEIPDSVTEMGIGIFYYCLNLKSASIGNGVTTIGGNTFHLCRNLVNVTIGNGVTTIDDLAFESCRSLESISLPDGVTTIGDWAFSGCSSLTEFVIPDNVTVINEYVFSGCSGLQKVEFPDGIVSIGNSAFKGCESLDNITIPDNVVSIGKTAFMQCKGITNITIPGSVTSIGDSAFQECSSLTSIEIPNTVTSIGTHIFSNCTALTDVTISDGISSVTDGMFSGCTSLNTIELPDSVVSIGKNTFSNCTSLSDLEIPDSAASIGDYAFSNCTSLTNIEIPDTVTSMGTGVFSNCSDLADVSIGRGTSSIPNGMFYSCINLNGIKIPDNITSIGSNAFSGCIGLESVEFPDSVTLIGSSAFYDCQNIVSIVIPDSVKTIDTGAFSRCTGLTKVSLGNELSSIGDDAFEYCSSLKSISVPNNVTSIGDWAFNGCSSLTEFVIPDNVTSIGKYIFNACTALSDISIGEGIKSISEGAFRSCTGFESIMIPDNVTTIGDSAFSKCTNLENIEIPDRAEVIGSSAFNECTSLKSIVIPDNVTSIGDSVFYKCTALKDILIGSGITKIGSGAFGYCSGLETIRIPDNVTTIGSSAFSECTSLKSIVIPDNVSSIGNYVFSNCTALKDVSLGNGISSVTRDMFSGCTGLTNIDIPDNITSIGYRAFLNCSELTGVTIPESVTSIDLRAFNGCDKVTLYVLPGSYAEQFAIENNIPYELILDGGLRLIVYAPDGNEIKTGFNVNWYEKGSDTIIATGNILGGIDEDTEYEYEIVLDEELGTKYYQPKRQTAVLSDKIINITLSSIPTVKVTGSVTDIGGKALSGVNIEFKQMFNAQYEKSVAVVSGEDGSYSAEISDVPTVTVYSKDLYYSRTVSVITDTSGKSELKLGKASLVPLPENKITISLRLICAARAGETPKITEIHSTNNIDITLYDKTQDRAINSFTVQYPYITISDTFVNIGDEVIISASDTSGNSKSEPTSFILDAAKSGNAVIDFVQNGKMVISNISTDNNRIMIFKENGDFLKSYSGSANVETDIMPAGKYSVVVMKKINAIGVVPSLNSLNDLGLQQGDDYALFNAEIKTGAVTLIDSVSVPDVDESRFDYTDRNETSLTVNTTSVTTGLYFSIRATYSIKSNCSSDDETVVINLPEGVESAVGGVTVDGKPAVYSDNNGTVTVKTNKPGAIVRVYCVATESGEHNIGAYVSFKNNGTDINQSIGTVCVDAESAKISVPEISTKKKVTVTGITLSKSKVTVYNNGELAAVTTSNSAGKWSAEIELNTDSSYSHYNIYAVIENENLLSDIKTETKELIFDETAVIPKKITMINTAQSSGSSALREYICEFDIQNPSKTLPEYWYWSSYPTFTFKVEFMGDVGYAHIEDVYVVTTNSAGDETRVPVTYDSYTGQYLGKHDYTTSADIPVTVGLEYSSEYDPYEPYNMLKEIESSVAGMDINMSVMGDEIQYDISEDGETMTYVVSSIDFDNEKERDDYRESKYPEVIVDGLTYATGKENCFDYCLISETDDGIYYIVELKNQGGVFSKYTSEIPDAKEKESVTTLAAKSYSCKGCGCMDAEFSDDAIDAFMQWFRRCSSNQSGLYDDVIYSKIESNLRARRIYANTSAIFATYNSIQTAGGAVNNPMEALQRLMDISDSVDHHISALSQYQSLFNTMRSWRNNLKCGCTNSEPQPPVEPQPVSHTLDPSGYVCEAVPSNRLEGVTATLYTEQEIFDDFGFSTGRTEIVQWNAEDYNQINPRITDINGEYAWFVPDGQWQVKYEKTGYETAYSDWLTVPPPQTDVHISMVSTAAPEVETINAYEDNIRITFTQYMDIETVNTNNIKVYSGSKNISGRLEAYDAEASFNNPDVTYARTFMFIPDAPISGDVSIDIENVRNYNGKMISLAYAGTNKVAVEPKTIEAEDSVDIEYNSSVFLEVSVLPLEAAKGLKITAESTTPGVVSVVNGNAFTGADGKAKIMLSGNLPGSGNIILTVEGTDITKTITANVKDVVTTENPTCSKVTASVESGSAVEYGKKVSLSTKTEGAEIYYTLDGTDPTLTDNASRIKYTDEIIITGDTVIIAYAVKDGYEDSPTAGFAYYVSDTNPTPTPDLEPTSTPTTPTSEPTPTPDSEPTSTPTTPTSEPTPTPDSEPTSTPTTEPSVVPTESPADSWDYEINDITVEDMTINVSITKNYGADGKLIIALYSDDGALIGVTFKDIDDTGKISVELNTDKAEYVSAFIWDNLSKMTPVSKKVRKKV